MRSHRVELERLIGADAVDWQERYLDTVVALAERRAGSRMMYLAETR